MNSHLTPGAKALVHQQHKVTLLESRDNGRAFIVEHENGLKEWWPVGHLTPLISATITEDGKAREVNPHSGQSLKDEEEYEGWREAWQETEASRRTWEVKECKINCKCPDLYGWQDCIQPGTPVLGYESPDGRFVIVEVRE